MQVKFSLSYILIIAAVLIFMNTYPLTVSEDLVVRSKQTTLQNSVNVMVTALSGIEELNEENVASAMTLVEETGISRILVYGDRSGAARLRRVLRRLFRRRVPQPCRLPRDLPKPHHRRGLRL